MPVKTILLAGPTASGKTALAITLAQELDGIVINADALQVYRQWRVLTARPTESDLAAAPHYLFGHVNVDQSYSVGEWIKEVKYLIETKNKTPIITGGTGLYFSTLLNGLSDIPAIPEEIRAEGNARKINFGPDWFLKQLRINDPDTLTKIDQNNPARVQRAWEVLEATGKGLSYWHARPARSYVKLEETMPILLNWNVNDLNDRIDKRFDIMMDNGAIEECEAALKRGFLPELPGNRAIGAREIIEALESKRSLENAVARSKILTHQFAKRQRTWFRNKMQNWRQIKMSDGPDLAGLVKSIIR